MNIRKKFKIPFQLAILVFILFIILQPIVANGDGAVLSRENIVTGDLDGDGKVTSEDYAYMKKFLLGEINSFPIDGHIISSIDTIQVSINQNAQYHLPNTITAKMVDGSFCVVPVIWNVESVDTSKIGVYYYEGTVAGYSKKIVLQLNVLPTPTPTPTPISNELIMEDATFLTGEGTINSVAVSKNYRTVDLSGLADDVNLFGVGIQFSKDCNITYNGSSVNFIAHQLKEVGLSDLGIKDSDPPGVPIRYIRNVYTGSNVSIPQTVNHDGKQTMIIIVAKIR